MNSKKIRIFTYLLYLSALICISFYPGKNAFLALYAMEPTAFTQRPALYFTPREAPYLTPAITPQDLSLISAASYIVLDATSLTPLLEKNARARRFPASTVKLATALVALDTYSLTTPLTVKTVIDEDMRMGLVPGERISLLNLLYGLFLYSANDAAYTIAENDPQGVDHFIDRMNELATKLQLTDTQFRNPIGFDDKQQYSTAYDLARLASYASQNPLILSISSTKNITVSDESYTLFHSLYNINQLLGDIPGVGGLKTGSTDGAGENLITYFNTAYQARPVIMVIMGSQDRFADTRILIELVRSRMAYRTL